MHRRIIGFILILFATAACKTVQKGLFTKQSPHEEYLSKLRSAGLDNNIVGKSWMQAATESLKHPVSAKIPSSEAMVFDYEHLAAAVYTFSLKEGQNLHVLVEPETDDTTEVFIDLFRIENGEPQPTAHAEKDSLRLDYRARRSGDYLVRVQPELLAHGLFTIYLFNDASLNFPVPGKDFKSISSFFGDPRDGGRRKHEGVDIFAARGTPALAVSEGRVIRTGNNRLGGKVVWITDTDMGYNYYYAHLDSQLVKPGMRVNAGDTVGLIGNTGNAVTTPPHLHFGIYAFGRRSIDPYVFFHWSERAVVDSLNRTRYAGNWGIIAATNANLRVAPGMDAEIKELLPGSIPVWVRGVSGDWLRIEHPDGEQGYVHNSLVKPVNTVVGEYAGSGEIIRSKPADHSRAKRRVSENESLPVFAEYNSYLLVEVDGTFGWIAKQS